MKRSLRLRHRCAVVVFVLSGLACLGYGVAMMASPATMRAFYDSLAHLTPGQGDLIALLVLALGGLLVAGAPEHPLKHWFAVLGVLTLAKGLGLLVPGLMAGIAAWYAHQPDAVWRGLGLFLLLLGAAIVWRLACPPGGHQGGHVGAPS